MEDAPESAECDRPRAAPAAFLRGKGIGAGDSHRDGDIGIGVKENAGRDIARQQQEVRPEERILRRGRTEVAKQVAKLIRPRHEPTGGREHRVRTEEHTSALQPLMRISYDDFCLTNKTPQYANTQ